MSLRVLVLVPWALGSMALQSAAADNATAKDDWDLLCGEWKLVSWLNDGNELNSHQSTPPSSSIRWIITRDQLQVREGEREMVTYRMRIDPTATPKRYDLRYEGDDPEVRRIYDAVIQGIYEIDGDTLRRCYEPRGGLRPSTFESKRGSGNSLMTLERVPKK